MSDDLRECRFTGETLGPRQELPNPIQAMTPANPPPNGYRLLAAVAEALDALPDAAWPRTPYTVGSRDALAGTLEHCVATLGVARGEMFRAVRIALMGDAPSPPLPDVLNILGRQESLRRLREER